MQNSYIEFSRSRRHITNMKKKQVQSSGRLSHDSLYPSQRLFGFIICIKTTADLEVTVGSSELFEDFNKLLQLKDHIVTIFYDEIFNLCVNCCKIKTCQLLLFNRTCFAHCIYAT